MNGDIYIYSYGQLLVITGYKWDYTIYKWGYKYNLYIQNGAPKIAKLVYNSNNYGFMVLITIVTGAYKTTYNWWGTTLYIYIYIYIAIHAILLFYDWKI